MEGLGADAALLHEAESAEVACARDTFACVRQHLASLQQEARSLCPTFLSFSLPTGLAVGVSASEDSCF